MFVLPDYRDGLLVPLVHSLVQVPGISTLP